MLAALARPAAAHQSSVKYVDIAIDGRTATVELTVAPSDVTEPLGLSADARPSAADAARPAVAGYVQRWLAIAGAGAPCSATAPRARASADARFVVVQWQVSCGEELTELALDFRAFFAVDPRHEAIATVHAQGAEGNAAWVRRAEPIVRVRVGQPLGLFGWIAAGTAHIWDGRDHVSFVIALLLVVVLVRRAGLWATRPALATLRHTAGIITAFTVAHSLSLIAASLGWLSLPGRLVESLIAVSILYTAIENVVRPDARWRFALAFGFGLVHGLGFASVLRVQLPPDHVIGPLLGFNLGVELGQLVIVAIALPLVWLCAHELGAVRYRRRVMPALSIAIAGIAANWLVERAFGRSVVTFLGM